MKELNRKELIHTHPGMKKDDFLEAIDVTGGWPVGYKYVSFYHAAEYSGRYCKFTNDGTNSGWWTVVCNEDDYHWWKLSGSKKEEVFNEARRQLIRQLN
jgi:hypothetical protein